MTEEVAALVCHRLMLPPWTGRLGPPCRVEDGGSLFVALRWPFLGVGWGLGLPGARRTIDALGYRSGWLYDLFRVVIVSMRVACVSKF